MKITRNPNVIIAALLLLLILGFIVARVVVYDDYGLVDVTNRSEAHGAEQWQNGEKKVLVYEVKGDVVYYFVLEPDTDTLYREEKKSVFEKTFKRIN